jgi:hypothetical protein
LRCLPQSVGVRLLRLQFDGDIDVAQSVYLVPEKASKNDYLGNFGKEIGPTIDECHAVQEIVERPLGGLASDWLRR